MNRAAIVTGAAGGIGSALTAEFADAGYRVVATDVTPPAGPCDAFVAVDLDRFCVDETYRHRAQSELQTALAGVPLGALINNAAVQRLGGVGDLSPTDWRLTLNVNLTAPFLLSQAFLRELEAGRGTVIHIGSIHATATKPGFVAYATSKAAIAGLTRAMAVDLGARVRVNAIAPAAVATPMLEAGFEGQPDARKALDRAHPVGRIGLPEEVARLAVFLASSGAAFMSGTVVGLDGAVAARLHDPV